MADTFFITTAIDYTNGAPHIGHAYEKVLADVLARYHRLKGDEVFFLTGVDQHGQKVQQSAEKAGVSPQQFVDEVTKKFINLWDKLDVHYDQWAATTDPRHKDCVRAILQRLWDEKDPATGASRWIYKKSQRGFYSVRQEQFLTDKERGEDGQFGPEWGQVEERDEENYYFRLADHKQWLLDLIDQRSGKQGGQDSQDLKDLPDSAPSNPVHPQNPANPVSKKVGPLVVPDFRVAELRNAVEKLEGDLCISRPLARLTWGIPFPFNPDFVTYVWFDALVNYISFAPDYDPAPDADLTEFRKFWPALHVIGKDIMIPAHGVYWPIMLKALGFSDDQIPPLLVHGWWNISGAKMSKSEGNVIDPDALADKYGAETLRYYLMSDITTGKDSDFSEERLVQRYNTDLANSLGNLLNRALNMAHKYSAGLLRRDEELSSLAERYNRGEQLPDTPSGTLYSPLLIAVLEQGATAYNSLAAYRREMDPFAVNAALNSGFAVATSANLCVERTQPWQLAKQPENKRMLEAVLYALAESLRIIAILLYPVMPKAAHGIFDQLGWKLAESGRSQRFHLADAKWGGLPDGHLLGKPTPLFPRIEVPPVV